MTFHLFVTPTQNRFLPKLIPPTKLGILALTQALCHFESATPVKDAPNDTDAHLYLAQALEKVGQTQEAMHAYRRVLALDPHNKIANAASKPEVEPHGI